MQRSWREDERDVSGGKPLPESRSEGANLAEKLSVSETLAGARVDEVSKGLEVFSGGGGRRGGAEEGEDVLGCGERLVDGR